MDVYLLTHLACPVPSGRVCCTLPYQRKRKQIRRHLVNEIGNLHVNGLRSTYCSICITFRRCHATGEFTRTVRPVQKCTWRVSLKELIIVVLQVTTANRRSLWLRMKSSFGLAVTLTFDLLISNVIRSSLSPTAQRLYIGENSHKRFLLTILLMCDHVRTISHGQPENNVSSG